MTTCGATMLHLWPSSEPRPWHPRSRPPQANVCVRLTWLNLTTSPARTASAPRTGCSLRHTTRPSTLIVRAEPSSGTSTTPFVSRGAATVNLNESSFGPLRHLDASGPAGVGACPCAHRKSPVSGATINVL
jgi:hypothetical protein